MEPIYQYKPFLTSSRVEQWTQKYLENVTEPECLHNLACVLYREEDEARRHLKHENKYIYRFQIITRTESDNTHVSMWRSSCMAGCYVYRVKKPFGGYCGVFETMTVDKGNWRMVVFPPQSPFSPERPVDQLFEEYIKNVCDGWKPKGRIFEKKNLNK